ncbi:MAG: alpha-1,6-glucosidase domain-containing protein [Caldilineales bacterium]
MGLPVAGVNQDNWYLMTPLLSNPDIAPLPADIQLGTAMLQELYEIRYSSPLFRLQTAQEVEDHLTFYNNGPDQLPGLIVAGLSDTGDTDLDPAREQIVVLINANDEPQTFTDAPFAGMNLALDVIQANGVDDLVKTASFDPTTGSFTVPGRTAAVFDDFLGIVGTVTQTGSTNPVVIGTYIDVDVSATNYGDTLADAVPGAHRPGRRVRPRQRLWRRLPADCILCRATGGREGLAQPGRRRRGPFTRRRGGRGLGRQFPTGETVDFGFAVQVTTSSGEVQTSVALFDGATFVTSFDSDALTIVDNSTYPVSRSRRFNVDRDSYINGTQPGMYYGSDQTMWVGFYDQMRPVVHTPINGIPGDAAVDQAWLYLYVTEGRKFGNWSQSVLENVTAHPATTVWMPYAVNWWMPWTMPGGDYGPGGVPNHLGSGKINTWLRLDVTAAVQDMLRSGENQGFLINSDVNASGVHYGLATKEYWDPSKLGYIRVYFRTALTKLPCGVRI